MPTLKSRMFNAMMRNQHLFNGKLHKPRFDDNTSIEGFREECEKGVAKFGKLPEGLDVKTDTLDGIAAEWLVPHGADTDALVMVHGGGYVSGSCSDHRGIVAKFAQSCGVTNLLYEYRLWRRNIRSRLQLMIQ